MFWKDDEQNDKEQTSDKFVDLSIQLNCPKIPADHVFLLAQEIYQILPWARQADNFFIQPIYIPASANGWERAQQNIHDIIHLPRRIRFKIRCARKYTNKVEVLLGQQIYLSGHPLIFTKIKVMEITASDILVSRFVHIPDTDHDEEAFLQQAYTQLQKKNIRIKKMLCGKITHFTIDGKRVLTRSLMLADLLPHESLVIQESGIGKYNQYGMGIFIPQKGIKALNQE